jgi:hypothetical protein
MSKIGRALQSIIDIENYALKEDGIISGRHTWPVAKPEIVSHNFRARANTANHRLTLNSIEYRI